MPRIFYDEEITKNEQPRSGSWSLRDELNTCKLSDEDLIQLMDKYKEKLQRYTVFNNEEKERTERKILLIHLEQVKRFQLNNNK